MSIPFNWITRDGVAVARKQQSVEGHEGPVIELGWDPFRMDEKVLFEQTVGPLCVADERLSVLIDKMNAACREWALERRLEVAPSAHKQSEWYRTLARKAADLAKLLCDPEDMEVSVPVSEPQAGSPALLPYDEDRVSWMQMQAASLEHLPEDPTAEADGSLPWHLDRLRDRFDLHYFGDPPEPRAFQLGNEALLEIAPILRAVAAAADDEVERLRQEAPADRESASGTSANNQLMRRLVPVYKELFGRELGRSMNPVISDSGEPTRQFTATGPAIRFFRFVFSRLQICDPPSDNTIGAWIENIKREADKP